MNWKSVLKWVVGIAVFFTAALTLLTWRMNVGMHELHKPSNQNPRRMGYVRTMLREYKSICGFYPNDVDSEEFLSRLNKNDCTLAKLETDTSFNKKFPVPDSWGSVYRYVQHDGVLTMLSYGKDLREGGSGDDADISFGGER